MTNEVTATLLIGACASRCGHCRQAVLPKSTHHIDVCGLSPKPAGGCGARFTDMAADGIRLSDDQLRAVRPDLPITRAAR